MSDHCNYLKDYLEAGIPIYTNDETVKSVGIVYGELLHGVPEKRPFMVGNFKVTPFYVPHDGTPCFAYKIFHEEIGNLLFLTDLEYCKYKFKDINHILCEANYSKDILNRDSPNSDHVIKGHMEIGTTLDFLHTNDNPQLYNVVLLHLSDVNSNAELFSQKTKEILPYANVYVAGKGMEIELNNTPF